MCLFHFFFFFFFNDTATTEIYTLSLHDALPISICPHCGWENCAARKQCYATRSEEHTSELQSRQYLVCRLLLEKKKKITIRALKIKKKKKKNKKKKIHK